MKTSLFIAALALVACGAPPLSRQSQSLDNTSPDTVLPTSNGQIVSPAPAHACKADSDCPNGFFCSDPCAPPKMCPVSTERICMPKPMTCETNCDCPVNSYCSVPPLCACPPGAACMCPAPPQSSSPGVCVVAPTPGPGPGPIEVDGGYALPDAGYYGSSDGGYYGPSDGGYYGPSDGGWVTGGAPL